MPFKGYNSVLFDFDSIVDLELSWLLYYAYSDAVEHNNEFIDMDRFMSMNLKQLRAERMKTEADGLFESLLIDDKIKDKYKEFLKLLIDRDFDDMVSKEYISVTKMVYLIKSYMKAADGIIHCSIHCRNDKEKAYIQQILPRVDVIVSDYNEVDTSKYGRIVTGYAKSAFNYVIKEPKSILVLNYSENFYYADNGITLLSPELIIKFGDINEILVVNAYDISEEDRKEN